MTRSSCWTNLAREEKEVVEILYKALSDEMMLHLCANHYKWNILDSKFDVLHRFCTEISSITLFNADRVAERIRSLRHRAIGSDIREYILYTRVDVLADQEGEWKETEEMLLLMVRGHETLVGRLDRDVKFVRDRFGDPATGRILLELIDSHRRMIWQMRALLFHSPTSAQ